MTKDIHELFESEFYIEDRSANIKFFIGKLRFSFARADSKNRNGRIYPSGILKREVERMNGRIEESPVAGMLEHEPEGLIRLDRISHVITGLEWNEQTKTAWAEARILRTQKGQDLLVLLNSVRLGASMVGHGDVIDGIVQDSYELKSIDLVSDPSFGKDAEVSAKNLIESLNTALERETRLKDESELLQFYSLLIEGRTAGHSDPRQYAQKILKEKKCKI